MLHALRSEVALRQGDPATARSEAMRAYRLQPLNPAATQMLAVALAGRDGAGLARAEAMSAKARALAGGTALARR